MFFNNSLNYFFKLIGIFFESQVTSTVEKIERFAFYDCKNLKTVTLNEGLKEIDSGAFRDCDKLGRIECNVRKNYVEANRSKFEGLIQKKSIINWLNG